MDENKRDDKIDLTSFDLSQFDEYVAEEDAIREAEQKAEAERIAREEAKRAEELRIQQEAELKRQQEEQRRLEKEAAERAALNAQREEEEARRAAAKAAQAEQAAKKAEQARQEANIAAPSELAESADVEAAQIAGGSDEDSTADFAQITSVLDYEEPAPQEEEIPDYLKEDLEGKGKKSRSGLFTAIVIILILAIIASLVYSYIKFSGTSKPADTGTQQEIPVSQYAPYADLITSYKSVKYPQGINEDLKPMYSQNSDLAGWVTIDGTNIDFPVMQDKKNTYYLNYHNAFNKDARYGTPFLDFRCFKTNLNKNTIIYGHHMPNMEHFGSLDNFVNVDYYKKHPVIEYQNLTGSYKFKIYTVFYATTQPSVDGGYVFEYYNPNMSNANFGEYIKMLDQYALYTTEAGLLPTDKIITLSTCSHVYDKLRSGGVDTRLVLVGRLLREGEDESVNTDNVTLNEDYRRPQLWYTKNGKSNPYAAYRSWTPKS